MIISAYRHRVAAVCAGMMLALAGMAVPAARAMELEAVLSAPMASDLVRSKAGDSIAWVENSAGRRSVHVASAPGYAPREVFALEGDRGEPLSALRLSADGALLAFARGGGPNAAGSNANPASLPRGGIREVVLLRTADGATVSLGEGSPAAFSPDGAMLLLARSDGLYRVAAEGAFREEAPAPDALLTLQGKTIGAVFSPAGDRIAFVSARRAKHSLIGVLELASNTVTWIAPSAWQDEQPTWSPDGESIAFLRRRPLLIGERLDITAGHPFRVMVAAADGSAVQEAWSTDEPASGLPQFLYGRTLWWPQADRLLFYSEHDGFLRLYGVEPTAGATAEALSPASCEVLGLDLAPDRDRVAFAHNCGDSNRRHVAAVDLASGELSALTEGEGIEVGPRLLAGGALAVLAGDHRQPMAATLHRSDGSVRRLTAPPPAVFPADALQAPEPVHMTAADGVELHGQLFRPADHGGKRPAVIFLHGGPIRQMLLGWHDRGYYANAYGMNQYLASRGFVVLSLNYRAGIGYGRDFHLAPNTGPRGASEYLDVLAARQYLAGLDTVDADRIGLWGGSYGGNLTALALARNSDLFAAGVDLHGVHDWSLPMPGEEGRYWGLADADRPEARASSPVAHIEGWRSPVLLISGDDDRNVRFDETVDLYHRLLDRGVDVEVLVLPDEVHGFHRHASWLKAYGETAAFLAEHLGSAPSGARAE
ncbi:prolyl oligopeptidase family serine peptidase [Pseudohaliea sp.]|uniref:S9 family peptidase n=1 Tax=Pseudohaliea sp. TaxID=2740289 RepID=UPI0032EB4174